MLLVAIVGDPGSGKTTFLGLLYSALVSSGSDKEDDLRFHVAYESIDEITALFQRLMSGGFPDTATKEGVRELRVELGAGESGHGIFARLAARGSATGASTTIRFTLPGDLEEATEGIDRGSTFGTGPWRDALDADVLLLLVDSTKLAPESEELDAGPMAAYDRQIESLLTAIRRWRVRGGREVVHPIFVFSKFDSVAPELLTAAGLDPTPPNSSEEGPRAAYAKALLEPNLPRTLALLGESGKARPRFADATYVFSSVRTKTAAPGQRTKIKLRGTDHGGWEPDYSRDEYVAFLEVLAGIAAETND
jgi:hypothetical protein